MSDSTIHLGAFVWYAAKGIGRVEETGGSPAVLFWSDRKSGKTEKLPTNLLTPLGDYIPEAKPPEAKPQGKADEADPWKLFEYRAKKAPLKLVALALSACGNSGGTADIKEKLDRRAPVGSWGSWWKRTEPKLGEMPSHFKIDGAGEDVKYILLSSIADVPADWIEPKVTPADWKKWLSASVHEPPPGRFPTKPVADALAKWPAKTIEQALDRVTVTAEGLLPSGSVSPQAAEGWLRAVAQASLRWREVADPDPLGHRAARIGALLARLSRAAGDRTPQVLLLRAGALDGEADAWRRGFAAGMWEAFGGEDARDLYHKSSAVLWRQAREDLAREVALAAFDPSYSARRNSGLDRLLDDMPMNDRHQLIGEIVAFSARAPNGGVLDYIANSRHAAKSTDAAERLRLMALATLMLSSGQDEVANRASSELSDALDAPEEHKPSIQVLLQNIRERHASKLEDLEQSYRARLKQRKQEHQKAEQQISDLERQMRNMGAELGSREPLEVLLKRRQDVLLAIGEVLQMVVRRQGDSIDKLAGNVEAGLTIALRAGGADVLDTSPEGKVVAPGVIVRDGIHGDRVLLKAQVKHEAS